VAYWRNAYPIHDWLLALPYSSHEVGRQQLEPLRGLVTEARRTGAKLVPLGQHEGTTYYSDASYWFHLERTEEYLEAILRTLPDDARIRYEFS
jgi:L-rhamnose isomerase